MGHSAGAYNVAMLVADPQWLQGVGMSPASVRGWIGLAGPYDFLPIVDQAVRPVFFYPDSPPESQPINHVSQASPPALLMAVRTDTLVNPVRNTGGLAYALRKAGCRCRSCILPVPATRPWWRRFHGAAVLAGAGTGSRQWLCSSSSPEQNRSSCRRLRPAAKPP